LVDLGRKFASKALRILMSIVSCEEVFYFYEPPFLILKHMRSLIVCVSVLASATIITFSVRVRIRTALRLAVYRQSFRLGAKPPETHDQFFVFS
jgi:hypothetical protein